jgi:putative sterol carrier protein
MLREEDLRSAEGNLKERMSFLVAAINKSQKGRMKLVTWIGKYDGKIVEFRVEDSVFHMVFTKERSVLKEGSYPSPDVILVAAPKLLMDILSGKTRLSSSLVANGKIKVWGNFHELLQLSKILSLLNANHT